ncbi:MAG: polysaccharide biosynthesis/export family protein, partial [Aureliella sp.]
MPHDPSLVVMSKAWDTGIRIATSGMGNGYDEIYVRVVYLLTGALLGKDYHELINRPNRVRQEQAEARLRFVHAGDTLAIYIPTLLPAEGSSPPVLQAGKSPPVTGYPVPVNERGEITLPQLGLLSVEGKTLKEVRVLIVQACS